VRDDRGKSRRGAHGKNAKKMETPSLIRDVEKPKKTETRPKQPDEKTNFQAKKHPTERGTEKKMASLELTYAEGQTKPRSLGREQLLLGCEADRNPNENAGVSNQTGQR